MVIKVDELRHASTEGLSTGPRNTDARCKIPGETAKTDSTLLLCRYQR
jgi:hypothetical protein